MRPVYCNNSTIDYNARTGEVALSFTHIYTEHKLTADGTGLTDVSARVVDESAHVIMSREAFLGLKRVVDNIAAKMDES